MKPKLIVLDGAKGAGKSTISNLLKDDIDNTAFIGIDLIRHLITKSKATDDFNKIAFEVIFSMTSSFLASGISVVVDSGINKERLNKLQEIAVNNEAFIFMFYLSAPKDVLWDRVKKRDIIQNKISNEERFNYTYEIQQSKDFSGFTDIDTIKYSPREICNLILDKIS